jgi:hypothetical protein
MRFLRKAVSGFLVVLLQCSILVPAQSTLTVTQTVNQRQTIGVLTASPSSGLTAGANVTFGYILHTAGAPTPTGEVAQFMDGTTAIGVAQIIASISGSNLLPYSQVAISNGWSLTGSVPVITANAANGPDGSINSATQLLFPDTTSTSSGVLMAVPGTAYAGLPMTLSVWAESASAITLTLALADSPSVAASGSNTCALTSNWQRCTFSYTFPISAGTGFSAQFLLSGAAPQAVNLWGAQVEQASAAGPFVSTIGTARATGGQGGSVTFPYSLFLEGTHSITAAYAGDANFVPSTSNALILNFGKATPGITLSANPATSSTYGQSVTLTAQLSGPSTYPANVPTGSVQFVDGGVSLGIGTVASDGSASVALTGVTRLPAGTHSITAVYGADAQFNSVTSTALAYAVAKVSLITISVSSSENPSTYGDSVTLSIVVASQVGATPSGTVSVMDGTNSLGTASLDSTGTGNLTIPLFNAGTHTLTVSYSGDENYN